MAIEFVNPLTAGTVLVRSDIRSQNYSPGAAGWIIEADGDAEFNSIVIRGGTVVSGTALYYDGTPALGNLILSIAAQAGTDAFGNAYLQGLAVYSSNGTIQANDTFILWESTSGSEISIGTGNGDAEQSFRPQDVGGVTWDDGALGMNLTSDFGANTPTLFLQSPSDHTNTAKSSIVLLGGSPSSNSRRIDMTGDVRMLGQITTYDSDAFTTYTPSITGGGTATFSTRTGYWQRIGPMVYMVAYAVVNAAGSGASNVQITAPTSIDRTTRQSVDAHTEALTAGNNGSSKALAFTSGSGATFDRIRNSTNGTVTGADLLANGIILVEGWYREG